MLDKATAKIKSEMDKEKNPYVQVVGQFLLDHLISNPNDGEKILSEEKTINKSLEEMRKVAEKKKVGNVAVLTDTEGFGIVLKYFGIDGEPVISNEPVKVVPIAPSTDFNVSLEEFL